VEGVVLLGDPGELALLQTDVASGPLSTPWTQSFSVDTGVPYPAHYLCGQRGFNLSLTGQPRRVWSLWGGANSYDCTRSPEGTWTGQAFGYVGTRYPNLLTDPYVAMSFLNGTRLW
jgi:hypothetical protein